MKGLVLDLRNSSGGLLDQAIEISDLFLNGGVVMSQHGRDPKDIEIYNALPGDILNGSPLAVLVNGTTGAGAEIVAGALQDRHRGVVVGMPTFGTGSVQTVIPIDGGKGGAIKLTTSWVNLPSGRSFQKTGLIPDLVVAISTDEAKDVSQRFSETSFGNVLDPDGVPTPARASTSPETPPATFDTAKRDFQLERAIELLAAPGRP